jgi:hypothetical protein
VHFRCTGDAREKYRRVQLKYEKIKNKPPETSEQADKQVYRSHYAAVHYTRALAGAHARVLISAYAREIKNLNAHSAGDARRNLLVR